MAEEDNKNAEIFLDAGAVAAGGSKKKLIILIVAVVLLLGGGAAAYFLLFSGDSSKEVAVAEADKSSEQAADNDAAATYVAMPRPFVFNVMDGKRDRLVQIKVQLMVRGNSNEELAKKHIPLLEGTLVSVFSASTVDQLRSPEGKDEIRLRALNSLNEATTKLEGKAIIHSVLFTGFVLQ